MIPTDPVAWATKAFRDERAILYATYGDYAAGRQPTSVSPSSASGPLGNLLLAMTYNRCGAVVDAVADRLHIEGFRDADGTGNVEPATDLWQENRMDKREGELYQEALTTGDGYAIVFPHPQTGIPGIWSQNAAEMRVQYDDEQPGLLVLATKMWRGSDDYVYLNVYLPDRLEKYISRSKYRTGMPQSAAAFERYQPGGPLGDLTWPLLYGWFRDNEPSIPVFHFANNARTGRYGTSELRDVIPLQDALNKAVTDLLKGSELGGHPQKHATGVDQDTADQGVIVGMDRVLASSHADARFGNFDATDLNQLVAVVNQFDLMIARTSRVPVRYLASTGNDVSGESKKMDDDPFVRKIEDRQTAFGNEHEDMIRLALRMGTPSIELAFRIEAVWAKAAPRSDTEQANLAVAYKQAGFPLPAICRLIELPEDEIEQIVADQDAAVERARAAFDAGEEDITGQGDTEAAA